MTENRGPASNMRGSGLSHNCAMYSVCPENLHPERVTASLFRGAVTIASASPRRHISVARRTYATAAAPKAALSCPKAMGVPDGMQPGSRIVAGTVPRSRSQICAVCSRTSLSPTITQSASAVISGRASAFKTTSGPIPAGSPMVTAIFMLVSFLWPCRREAASDSLPVRSLRIWWR
jgi:hypothetical protein